MFDDPGMEFLFTVVAVVGGGLFLAAYLVGFSLWLAGQLSGVLSGRGWPDSSPADVIPIVRAVIESRGDVLGSWPVAAQATLGPMWLITTLFIPFLAITVYIVIWVLRLALNFRRRRMRMEPLFRLGFASSFEVYRLLSKKTVLSKAERLRPSLIGRRVLPEDVGYQIGIDRRSRRRIYGSCEDSLLVVGAPRRGKDVHLCTSLTIDAPGACIVYTPRLDLFTSTYQARSKKGKVWVMDPMNFTMWPDRARWPISRGCLHPVCAHWRARMFIMWQMNMGRGLAVEQGGATDYVNSAVTVLQCYLMAVELSGKTTKDILRWIRHPTDPEPIDILRDAEAVGKGAPGWWADLEAATAKADHRFRGVVMGILTQALNSLEDPVSKEAHSPTPDEAFDIRGFFRSQDTLYVLAKDDAGCRALVLAMLYDLISEARDYASILPDSRLDPPLTLVFNEASVPLPVLGLPSFMSDLGGFNITMHVYLSSLSDGRRLWGGDGMAAIWDNASIRMVTGGGGSSGDLNALSSLMGSVRGRPVLSPEEIRVMKYNRAVLVAGNSRPVEVKLQPWWRRKDGKEIARGIKETEEAMRRHREQAARRREGLKDIEVHSVDGPWLPQEQLDAGGRNGWLTG